MSAARTDARDAGTIAAALTAGVLACGLLVRIAFAPDARELLGYRFAGVEPRAQTALSILAANAQLLLVTIAATVIVSRPACARPSAERPALAAAMVAAIDTLLALEVALNVVVVGAALGAYGTRMLAAMLPHGPFELAAFALALSLYLRVRRGRPASPARIATTASGGVLLLAVASVLETYVVP